MKYNKPRENLLTRPVVFICAMYISNTLIGTSANRWYCCRFAVCRGTLLGLRKPTDTKPLFHSLAMNQLESTDGLDFFAKNFLYEKKRSTINGKEIKKNNNNNKCKKPDMPNGKSFFLRVQTCILGDVNQPLLWFFTHLSRADALPVSGALERTCLRLNFMSRLRGVRICWAIVCRRKLKLSTNLHTVSYNHISFLYAR